MTPEEFKKKLKFYLNCEPTSGQEEVADLLYRFMADRDRFCTFLLKGYAGTGKTTIISAFIKLLAELKINTILLAPTGRAAKVLSSYSGHSASTIHKCIYRKKSTTNPGSNFSLNYNNFKNTIFIVDEASMIGNSASVESAFGTGRLLDDLFSFVFNDNNCRVILLGDTAQLPPVGTSISPALDEHYLKAYGLTLYSYELTEVVRQDTDSGILQNATMLRNMMADGIYEFPKLSVKALPDICSITGAELIDEIENSYSRYGNDETRIICRTNKYANKYNLGIRNRILWREEELCYGDLLMVVKNNYSWLPENSEIDFIANGDMLEVLKVRKHYEMYGHRYVDLLVRFVDFPDLEIEVKVLLDTLTMDSANMPSNYYSELWEQLEVDYQDIVDTKKRHEAMLKDQYYNALQIKYAYALTCHKSQGGQWSSVFVDHGWLNKDEITEEGKYEFLRWLYTAVTRATEKLYLVNFDKDLLE
ncbi:MAG: AAA family ATPase [Bacteroidales bacterium]|nr:AAA family ATPase [Bacteroidales bacterium]